VVTVVGAFVVVVAGRTALVVVVDAGAGGTVVAGLLDGVRSVVVGAIESAVDGSSPFITTAPAPSGRSTPSATTTTRTPGVTPALSALPAQS
jgi:hypothetical protein